MAEMFSYAYEEGFQNILFSDYMKTIPQSVLDLIKKQRIVYATILMTASQFERKDFNQEMLSALEFIKLFFQVEIDLDALPNIASSAMTERFSQRNSDSLFFFSKNKNAAYIHICEGAPD
jgi:formiminoglutamase